MRAARRHADPPAEGAPDQADAQPAPPRRRRAAPPRDAPANDLPDAELERHGLVPGPLPARRRRAPAPAPAPPPEGDDSDDEEPAAAPAVIDRRRRARAPQRTATQGERNETRVPWLELRHAPGRMVYLGEDDPRAPAPPGFEGELWPPQATLLHALLELTRRPVLTLAPPKGEAPEDPPPCCGPSASCCPSPPRRARRSSRWPTSARRRRRRRRCTRRPSAPS